MSGKIINYRGGELEICDCKTDNYRYSHCRFCGEETEICEDCDLVKAADCQHWEQAEIGCLDCGTTPDEDCEHSETT